jgi:hypothetical protein
MVDAFTKRNHYNPCFWTACWNLSYYQALLEGKALSINPRDQQVFVLNIQSGEIYPNRVKNVHFDKDLGVAEVTPESMKDFYRRRFPSEYENFCQYLEEHPDILYMDFEDILTGIEGLDGYKSLMGAVTDCAIQDVFHKGFLTCHIVLQAMRSHEMMNSMVKTMNSIGMQKWEYFWLLKNALGNKLVLARATTALAFSRWVLYVVEDHSYPLCDSPIMIQEKTLMAVLSPRLLLEINLNEPAQENKWTVRQGINKSKFREFQRRSIQNSFKEIIFHDRTVLERWRNTREFKNRSRDLRDRAKTDELRAEAANRVIWAINGFGKLPEDFESQIINL